MSTPPVPPPSGLNVEKGVRKSSRKAVPNPMYKEGINQLKNENTSRAKRKGNRANEQQISYEQERPSPLYHEQQSQISEAKEILLPCRLKSGRHVKVLFNIGDREKEKKERERDRDRERERERERQRQRQRQKEKSRQREIEEPQVNRRTQTTSNLLNLFYEAIQAPAGQIQSEIVVSQPPAQVQQKQAPIKPKRPRRQQEDFIKRVKIQNKKMIITHSQLEQLEFPVDWEEKPVTKNYSQDYTTEIEEIQRKLKNSQIIKGLSIFGP